MGKHLDNILDKGTAGTGGRADWKKKEMWENVVIFRRVFFLFFFHVTDSAVSHFSDTILLQAE